MSQVKEDVRSLLQKLPEDCTLEDIQYHLYIMDKVQKGINRAETEGTFLQDEVDVKLSKWIID